jgi:iron complex transport system ATP-binding protein
MQVQQVPLLKIDDATVQRNGVGILQNVSLEIPEGQHTAIVGPNGSGKSTLIKLIARLLYPLAHADGRPIVSIFGRSTWNVFELRTLLGIVSPDLHTAFTGAGGITGLDAVLSGYFASQGMTRYHEVTPEMQREAADALAELGASSLANKPMEIMSAGEARRVLIARALVHHPRALLLDEPTTGLDIVVRRRFMETLRALAAKGRTLLLVTHHIDEIIPEIERVVLMRDGAVFADGAKESVLTSSNLSEVFGIEIEVRRVARGYFAADLSATHPADPANSALPLLP